MKRHTLLFLLTGLLACGGLPGAAEQRTVITSESLEMQGSEARNFFHFHGDVRVRGTNLDLTCDALTVIAMRAGASDAAIGEIGAIERIIAVGSVTIVQAGRTATAGRVEVDPARGTVTLMDKPRIVDRDVEVEGFQFVLHQGERRFISIPDPQARPEQPSRSVVRLGVLPDLGFDQDEEAITIGAEQPAGDGDQGTLEDRRKADAGGKP
jgi:lipopolysaccharide export system protein LptA